MHGAGMHTGFAKGVLKETDHLEYLGTDRRIILKWILKTCDRKVWSVFIWLRIRKSG
jgi:hypothetical protein